MCLTQLLKEINGNLNYKSGLCSLAGPFHDCGGAATEPPIPKQQTMESESYQIAKLCDSFNSVSTFVNFLVGLLTPIKEMKVKPV